MKFSQPRLPYSIDALAPVISPMTIDYHYGKHEKAYIDTLNTLIEGTPFADLSLEEIIAKSDGKLFNNASQAWNHIFYFFQFDPNGLKEPTSKLRDKINEQFGSFEEFKAKFEEAGTTLFGSGWVWLSADSMYPFYHTGQERIESFNRRVEAHHGLRRLGTRILS